MSTVLYAERPVGRRGWGIFAAACVAGFAVVFLGAGGLHNASVLILAVLLVLVIGGPIALMLFSKNFYGALVVTPEHIRVGRETIAVQDLWPREALDRLDPTAPSPTERLKNSAGAIKDSSGNLLGPQGGRLAGGAWAVPLASDYITLEVKGEPVVITTNHRSDLIAAVRQAAQRTPASGPPVTRP